MLVFYSKVNTRGLRPLLATLVRVLANIPSSAHYALLECARFASFNNKTSTALLANTWQTVAIMTFRGIKLLTS